MEESQHARIDVLQLQQQATTMTDAEKLASIKEFLSLIEQFKRVLMAQDELDVANFEQAVGRSYSPQQRAEIVSALNQEFLWTFLVSGLEHEVFRSQYNSIMPKEAIPVDEIIAKISAI